MSNSVKTNSDNLSEESGNEKDWSMILTNDETDKEEEN